jgi:hypothetical protein
LFDERDDLRGDLGGIHAAPRRPVLMMLTPRNRAGGQPWLTALD